MFCLILSISAVSGMSNRPAPHQPLGCTNLSLMSKCITVIVASKGDNDMYPFLHIVPILAQVDATSSGQTVTVSFNFSQVITAIIVGLIAGALASVLVRGRRFGFLGSILLGILGAVVGGFIFS